MISANRLREWKFSIAGVLNKDQGNQFFFTLVQDHKRTKESGVYLWLKRTSKINYEVMYAGKAGSGIEIRMKQHLGGLKKASNDRISRLKEACGESGLEIWFRKSDEILVPPFLNNQYISNYSTEEEALITRFNPTLNRAKTPTMRDNARSETDVFNNLNYELCNSNGKQRILWEDALLSMTPLHKKRIVKAIHILSNWKELKGLEWKVIGHYSDGPIIEQTMLVLGDLVNENFRRKSKRVLISLENEVIAFLNMERRKFRTFPVSEALSLSNFIKTTTGELTT